MSESDNSRSPATFVALAVSTLFFGIIIAQAVLYYRHFYRDNLSLKFLVSAIVTLQLSQQVLLSIHAWIELVNTRLSEGSLRRILKANLFIDAAIVITAQVFNAYRIQAFNPRFTILVVACCTFLLGNMTLSIVMTVKLSTADTGQESVIRDLFIAINTVTWSTDVLLSAVLIIVLIWSKTGTSFGNRMVHKVIRRIFNMGIFTTVWGIVALIVMTRSPNTNVPALLYMTGTNSYTMSLLFSLISRATDKADDCEMRQPVEVELPEFNNPGTTAFFTIHAQVSSFPSEQSDEGIKASSEGSPQEVDEN